MFQPATTSHARCIKFQASEICLQVWNTAVYENLNPTYFIDTACKVPTTHFFSKKIYAEFIAIELKAINQILALNLSL